MLGRILPKTITVARWKTLVERMVWRMRGDGNLGAVMQDAMDAVQAGHPALFTQAGKIYALACTQCHALPDPQRYSTSEWPAVVQRMHGYMLWANTVTGDANLRTTPEPNTADIVLQRYAGLESTP